MSDKLFHTTITLEHAYPVSVERIFSEFADPLTRAKWSAPANDSIVYDEADFREGGRDAFRCGRPDDLRFRGITTYIAIVPNKCVVSTESLFEGAALLAVALISMEFEPAREGSKLQLTIQMVSFAGPGMFTGYESGNRSALEGLSRHLAAS